MDNIKLKKLGKYFTKGLQAGVLASALIAGNVSCSQPAGGNTYTPDNGTIGGGEQGEKDPIVNPDPNPTPTPTPTPTPEPEGYPSYYITEEFGGQRFVEADKDWFYVYDVELKNNEFTKRYDDAKKFMGEKVTELRNDLEGVPNSYGKDMVLQVLDNYNSAKKISNEMGTNYDALRHFFTELERPCFEEALNTENIVPYNNFRVNYFKLAQYAYNNSLGSYSGSTEFTTNKELNPNYSEFEKVSETVEQSSYKSFSNLTVSAAKNNMKSYLNNMAYRSDINISPNVLYKVFELALYNESLYGLNDMAIRTGITAEQLAPQRNLSKFDDKIRDDLGINSYSTRSIDDDGRTM